MIKRAILLLLAAVFILSIGVAMAKINTPVPAPGYQIERIGAGNKYQLEGLSWQVSGFASSSEYRLASQPAQPADGHGCCCAFLPCTLR
jgi:hypothetical protein